MTSSSSTGNQRPRPESRTSSTLTVDFEIQLLVCRLLTHPAGQRASSRRLRPQKRMCRAGTRERGKARTRGPATGCVFFSRLCNVHRRRRRDGHDVYETRFSTLFAKMANDDVGVRATDLALGLRRIHAGFYTVVQHSSLEWRTENVRSSVNHDIVAWGGPIPM